MGSNGSVEKMRIVAYSDKKFEDQVGAREVQINPDTYRLTERICYSNNQASGSPGPSPDFNRMAGDQLELELIFDGTGVVPPSKPDRSTADGVSDEIALFRNLVFTYHGNIHQPNFLQLIWGTLYFTCRLQKLDFNFKLFKPDGSPLRATAKATFLGYNDEEALALKANKSSPDLTHVRTVEAGDVLPLMCYRIYGSSAYYPQVAEANGLSDFRRLVVGTQLVFPPLGEDS